MRVRPRLRVRGWSAVRAVGDDNLFRFEIDLLHVAEEQVHAFEHLADGVDDVRHVEVAGRDLVQHRCE
jgi:hypothetical protein